MKQYRRKIKSITILGRKWFDKVNGNTYNTAQIMVNGETVGKTPFQYGYGDFYLQAAGLWLEENKYIKLEHYEHGGSQSLWRYCDENKIHFEYSAIYCLKREL
jgi:hypothetical protein